MRPTASCLGADQIFTVQPKGILIVGHTSQLINSSKRGTFERFRRNLANPEILTFDEVLDRAKFIVGNTEIKPVIEVAPADEEVNLDDIPF